MYELDDGFLSRITKDWVFVNKDIALKSLSLFRRCEKRALSVVNYS